MVFGKGCIKNNARKMDSTLSRFFAFFVFVLMPGMTSALDSPFFENIRGANLVFSDRKDYANYDLILGKMEYVEAADGEGFKPAAQKPLVGAIDRRLYDYPKQKSAIEIFEKAVDSLQRQRYKIIYRCSGDECGGSNGWKLFLSKKVGGHNNFQHYLVAVKERSSGVLNYAVMYVNDFGGQPRALVDIVRLSRTRSGANDQAARGGVDADKKLTRVYFNFGQYSLSGSDEQVIQAKKFVAANLGNCPIRVIGYTDPVGSESSNRTLAKARVDEIIKYISTVNELSQGCLIPEPRGVDRNAARDNFKSSRRVDLEVASNH
jgi:hypothetical protein